MKKNFKRKMIQNPTTIAQLKLSPNIFNYGSLNYAHDFTDTLDSKLTHFDDPIQHLYLLKHFLKFLLN